MYYFQFSGYKKHNIKLEAVVQLHGTKEKFLKQLSPFNEAVQLLYLPKVFGFFFLVVCLFGLKFINDSTTLKKKMGLEGFFSGLSVNILIGTMSSYIT